MADLTSDVSSQNGTFYSHMPRGDLIGYCAIHCKTERALFHKSMVAQMVEYAGRPKGFLSPEIIARGMTKFHSLHESMGKLVELARNRVD